MVQTVQRGVVLEPGLGAQGPEQVLEPEAVREPEQVLEQQDVVRVLQTVLLRGPEAAQMMELEQMVRVLVLVRWIPLVLVQMELSEELVEEMNPLQVLANRVHLLTRLHQKAWNPLAQRVLVHHHWSRCQRHY